MNQTDFEAAQTNKQVKSPKPAAAPQADMLAIVSALKRKIDGYLPYLEQLRNGTPTIGQAHNSGSQAVGSGGAVKATLNTVDASFRTKVDITTSHRITVTETGYYLVIGSITFALNATASAYGANIYKNGSAAVNGGSQLNVTTSAISVPISSILYLSPGDYVELFGSYSAGTSAFSSASLSVIKL